MAHINTLEYYDELVASGFTTDMARAQVKALNSSFDNVVTKDFLETKLNELEKRLENFMFKTIGGTLALYVVIPIILRLCKIF